MNDDDTKFEEFKELVKELSDAKAKLLKLEERKNTVRENVYERVKADYEEKLREAEKRIEEKSDYIEEAFNSYRSEIEDLVNQRKSIEEEVEELSLRHYLGEFENEEYERMHQEKLDMLESLMGKLEVLTSKINFLKEFLPESLLETLPEEAMISVSKEEAPPQAEEVVAEKPGEEAPKEEQPAESAETSADVGTEEKVAEQPAEMLSSEEADKLIEEKIYPAEENTDIMRQPELAPEAKEKEGVECPKCGMVNEPDSWYCERCGAQLLEEGTG